MRRLIVIVFAAILLASPIASASPAPTQQIEHTTHVVRFLYFGPTWCLPYPFTDRWGNRYNAVHTAYWSDGSQNYEYLYAPWWMGCKP